MSETVIRGLEQVTVEWLTAVLAASGALTRGGVAAFDVAGGRGSWSTNLSLQVRYTPDARGERPGRLFLKNETNILVPRRGERPVYLIDRQPFDWSLTTWLAAYDLAYIVALDWDVALHRRLELSVLRHYLQYLHARAISGYTWNQLIDDYRLAVAMGVYIATEYCRGGINEPLRFVWLRMLRRALTACDDLACSELWK